MNGLNKTGSFRVLICGDRNWTDEGSIAMFLSGLPLQTVVIHGACKGADQIAGRIANEMGFEVIEFTADWDTYGYSAGPIRNRQMLAEGKPDMVAAFHDDIEKSKGTKDMVNVAISAEVETMLFTSEDTIGEFEI